MEARNGSGWTFKMSLADVLGKVFSQPDPEVGFLAEASGQSAFFEPIDLVDIINRKLESTREIPIPTADTVYRVSSLVRMCPREEVLRNRLKVKKIEKIDARLQRIFDIGTSFHNLVQQEWFTKWGMLVGDWNCLSCKAVYKNCLKPKKCSCGHDGFSYTELAFKDEEYLFTGHCDGILEFVGNRRILLELKTCNSKQYQLITQIKKSPLQAHIDQVQLYMWMSGTREAIVLYIDKDESLLSQFWVKYDQKIVSRYLNNIADARNGMRGGDLPVRTICDSSSCARAKSCTVRKECFENK